MKKFLYGIREIPAGRKYLENMGLEKQFYTVSEIAKLWACSPDKVSRVFRDRPGVMDLGVGPRNRKGTRSYSILRIPRAVLRATEEEMTKGAR